MRRLLSLVLVLTMVLSLGLTANAAQKVTSEYEAHLDIHSDGEIVLLIRASDDKEHDYKIKIEIMNMEPEIIEESTFRKYNSEYGLYKEIDSPDCSHAVAWFYIDGEKVASLGEVR